VDEPGFDPFVRIELVRTCRIQLSRYLLDLGGGDTPEVSSDTATKKSYSPSDVMTVSFKSGTRCVHG
jgi:hypothetical protein